MSRRDREEAAFLAAPDREAYLRAHSGLPGPRGNLELMASAGQPSARMSRQRTRRRSSWSAAAWSASDGWWLAASAPTCLG